MRERHICPKCQHNHILLAQSVPDTGELSTEIRPLSIATVLLGQGWLGGDKLGTAGMLSAAICRRRGYSELYANLPERIPIDGTYVREVIGPEPTPFR